MISDRTDLCQTNCSLTHVLRKKEKGNSWANKLSNLVNTQMSADVPAWPQCQLGVWERSVATARMLCWAEAAPVALTFHLPSSPARLSYSLNARDRGQTGRTSRFMPFFNLKSSLFRTALELLDIRWCEIYSYIYLAVGYFAGIFKGFNTNMKNMRTQSKSSRKCNVSTRNKTTIHQESINISISDRWGEKRKKNQIHLKRRCYYIPIIQYYSLITVKPIVIMSVSIR